MQVYLAFLTLAERVHLNQRKRSGLRKYVHVLGGRAESNRQYFLMIEGRKCESGCLGLFVIVVLAGSLELKNIARACPNNHLASANVDALYVMAD